MVKALSPRRPPGATHPPFDAVADIRKHVVLTDDFLANLNGTMDDGLTTGLGALNWIVTDVNGSADSDVDLFTTSGTIQGHPGVIQLNSGGTSAADNDEGSLALVGSDGYILGDAGDAGIYGCAIIRLPSVTQCEFYFGLFDDETAAGRGVNAVAFELDISVNTYWQPVVVDGSAADAMTLAAPEQVTAVVDTWYTLEILAHEDSCLFWVNGLFIGESVDVDIPNDEGLNWVFKIGTETTAEKSVLIDAFQSRVSVDRTGF